MHIPFLDLKAQYLGIEKEIDHAIKEVIAGSHFIRGKYVELFEDSFAKAIGAKHCIGVGNGTDAITVTLKALGIRSGDEVITAANSFIATSEAITNAGAKVVFVDCHPKTYNIDVLKIKEKIGKKTKAIIPVHLYGQPADMNEVMELSKEYNLHIVEDAAQAHLSEYHGMKTGSIGHASTFSFYPGKNLGAYGDAGAVVTNNTELAKIIKMMANHGRLSKYNHEFEGFNSRMDGVQGAVLNIKLKYLEKWSHRRREIATEYNSLLSDIEGIVTPYVPKNILPVYHLYVIRTHRRDQLKDFLRKNNIDTGIHYPIILPELKAYKHMGHKKSDFPVAAKYQNQILSLPIYPEMKKQHIEFICDKIKTFFK